MEMSDMLQLSLSKLSERTVSSELRLHSYFETQRQAKAYPTFNRQLAIGIVRLRLLFHFHIVLRVLVD